MREFIITVNSTVDLPKEWLEERHVPVLPLKYTIDGETYTDMSGLTAKEFFQKLREGHMSVTSQINPEEAREMLEPFVKEGKDVLHLGFSSGLSGTCNSMRIAAEELAEDYPEVAKAALAEMVRQAGKPVFDERGMMKRGVIVRHLLLPGCLADGKRVVKYLHETYGNRIYMSLMSQYTPLESLDAAKYPELNRKVPEYAYEKLVDYAISLGVMQAFIQEGDTAKESFIPPFTLEGV